MTESKGQKAKKPTHGKPIFLRPSPALRKRLEQLSGSEQRSLNGQAIVLIEEALEARKAQASR